MRLLFFGIAILGLIANARPEKVRVATFNLYNRPWERRTRLENAHTLVKAVDPDITLLQEVATGWFLQGDPMELIWPKSASFRERKVVWHEKNLGIFQTGLGILSKSPIERADYHEFSKASFWNPKGFLHVEIMHSGMGKLHLFNLHLDSSRDASIRDVEFRELGQAIEGIGKKENILVGGDWNEYARSEKLSAWKSKHRAVSVFDTAIHDPTATWTPDYRMPCTQGATDRVQQPIDNILLISSIHGKTFQWIAGKIVLPVTSPYPSDHCLVYADLRD